MDGNLTGMLAAKGVTTPFDVQADSAPIIYVHHQPGRTTPAVRALERAAAKLTAKDVATGKTVRVTNYLADPVEMKLLHMVTGDPKRTATLALFGNPDFWLDSSVPASCGTKVLTCEPAGGDAWNHGDVASKINTTFLGFAGPGVRHLGVTGPIWSDHTDIQPTMMELLGLRDDYTPDGRVLAEVIKPSALRPSLKASYPDAGAARRRVHRDQRGGRTVRARHAAGVHGRACRRPRRAMSPTPSWSRCSPGSAISATCSSRE